VAHEDEIDTLPPGVYLEDQQIPPDRVKLFELEGKHYTAARHFPPNLVFKFMKQSRTRGVDMATFWLIEQIISEPVVDVLAEHEDLTEEQFEQVMRVVRKHTLGVMEKAGGK
jgi:hypothetical protein